MNTAKRKKHSLRIGLDIDDVLRNSAKALTSQYRKDHPTHRIKALKQWDMTPCFPIGEKIYKYAFETRAKEIFLNAPPNIGASQITKKLREMGHEVWLITSQPNKKCQLFTLQWLIKNGIEYDHLVFTKSKYRVDCHLLLDDAVHNLKSFDESSLCGNAICMTKPWNSEWQGRRVNNLNEFIALLESPTDWKIPI